MTTKVETPTAPLLPSTDSPSWTGGGMYGAPSAETIEARFRELDQARASLGLQPLTDEEKAWHLAPAPVVEDTKTKLEALAKVTPGPSAADLKELARVQAERDAARAATQTKLRKELAPVYERAAGACKDVEQIAKDFREVLTAIAKVPDETYLSALPADERSNTLVFQMKGTIEALLVDFRDAAGTILAQGSVLENVIATLQNSSLTPFDKTNILRERDAFLNLIELPVSMMNRVKLVCQYREQIERESKREGARAVTASTLPEIEQTPAQRTALARKLAAGR